MVKYKKDYRITDSKKKLKDMYVTVPYGEVNLDEAICYDGQDNIEVYTEDDGIHFNGDKSDLKRVFKELGISKYIKDSKPVKDSDEYHEFAQYELTFEDGSKEIDSIPLYVKRGMSEDEIIDYFQHYQDEDKIVSIKQIGWYKVGDKRFKDSKKRAKDREPISDWFIKNDIDNVYYNHKGDRIFESDFELNGRWVFVPHDEPSKRRVFKTLDEAMKYADKLYETLKQDKVKDEKLKDSTTWYIIKDEDIKERNVGNVPFFKTSLFGELTRNGFECKWKAGDLYTTCSPKELKTIKSEGNFINGPKTLAEFYLKPGYKIVKGELKDKKVRDEYYQDLVAKVLYAIDHSKRGMTARNSKEFDNIRSIVEANGVGAEYNPETGYVKFIYDIKKPDTVYRDSKKVKDSEYKETTDENIEALQEYLDWEGIIGYTYEIVEVYETNEAWVDEELETYDNAEEALDAFFEWEGIYGYTDAVMDILENGKDSSYYQDMLEEKNKD